MSMRSLAWAWCPPPLKRVWQRLEASPLGYRLAHGAFWSLVGAVISRALALLAAILVARQLGPEGFGELGIIQSTVGMFGVFAGFGLGMTATKYVAEFRRKDPAKAGRIMAMSGMVALISGGAVTAVLIGLAPWLATHTLAAPQLSGLLQDGGGLLFLGALNGAQTGALAGFEAFRTIAVVNFWGGVANFPLMVGGVYLAGLRGAVWGMVAALAVGWVLNHWALRLEARRFGVPFGWEGCWRESKVLFSFSLPALLSMIMVGPVNWACAAMLVNQPEGYREMGIFNAANQWFTALLFLPGILGQVVLPILSERIGHKDNKSSKKVLSLSIKLNVFCTAPIVVILCFFSGYIMALYGQNFSSGSLTLIVISITAFLVSIQNSVGQFIAASNVMWIGFLMNLGWALFFLIITLAIVDWGSLGLATARGIAYFMHSFWVFIYAINLLNKKEVTV